MSPRFTLGDAMLVGTGADLPVTLGDVQGIASLLQLVRSKCHIQAQIVDLERKLGLQ